MAYLEETKRDIVDLIPGQKTKVEFSRDLQDQKLLRKLVRDSMYSDTYAFIREIASNAYDACVENKSSRKPQVILKKADIIDIDDKIIFKDFGKGMSKDFMLNSFAQLGKSTKREDNTQIGSRGLGRVSPLKYTDNFTIITRYEGIEYTWFIYLDEEDEISVKYISEKPTDEIGTEVIINIKDDVDRIIKNLQDKLRFLDIERIGWEPKKELEIFYQDELGIVYSPYYKGGSYSGVNLGGIFYEFPDRFIFNAFPCVVNFEIGELTLPATREHLENTEENINKIKNKVNLLVSRYKSEIQKIIASIKDPIVAYVKSIETGGVGLVYPVSKETVFYKIDRNESYREIPIDGFAKGEIKMAGSNFEISRIRGFFKENPSVEEVYFIRIPDDEYSKMNLNYLRVENYKKIVYKKEKVQTRIWGKLNGSSCFWLQIDKKKTYVYGFFEDTQKINFFISLKRMPSNLPEYDVLVFGKSRKKEVGENFIYYEDFLKQHFEEIKRVVLIRYFEIRRKEIIFFEERKANKIKEYVEVYNKAKTYLQYSEFSYFACFYQPYFSYEDSYIESLIQELERIKEKYLLLAYIVVPYNLHLEELENKLIELIDEHYRLHDKQTE